MLDEDIGFLSSHDHNFKNLKVDYPLQAIEFFAHEVFPKIEGNPKVMPLRQEQQKDNLADRYRALDTPNSSAGSRADTTSGCCRPE